MMLIGMSLYTWGIFSNSRKESFYKIMVFYGFGIGFPMSILGLGLSYFFEWNWLYSQFPDRIPNTISTPFISYGYIRYDLLWSRKEFLKSLKNRLESIGKTALTCYLIQSVISTFIFCGFGLGLYGHLIE